MSPGHSVELHELTKAFERFTALDHVTATIEGNRTVGYLGPNGAGKTTTLKILCGLLRPSSGHATIDGVDVTRETTRSLWNVGAVIETPEPYAHLTVREALEMVGEFRGMTTESMASRIDELSGILELPPFDRRLGKLSKGQRQRVVLAATVLADPPVLLLDEPTSGLDPAERVRIRNLLLSLKRDHLILMSSHLLGEVTETCDEVIFINQGKILLRDTVERIAERIRSTQVDVEFLTPVTAAQFAPLGELVHGVTPVGARRFRLTFDGRDEARPKLLEACQRIAPVTAFVPVGSALEDTYLQLMGGNGLPPPPGAAPPSPA